MIRRSSQFIRRRRRTIRFSPHFNWGAPQVKWGATHPKWGRPQIKWGEPKTGVGRPENARFQKYFDPARPRADYSRGPIAKMFSNPLSQSAGNYVNPYERQLIPPRGADGATSNQPIISPPMPRSFIPRPDDKRVTWLNAYADGLALSIGQAGITAGDAARARADADYFAAIVSWKADVRQAAENVTAYVDQIANGLPPGIDPSASPAAPVMPVYPADAPPAVPWDVIGRASKSAARIKIAPGYTPALGRLLGIIATTPEPRPVQDLQPDLKVPGLNAGHPMLRFAGCAATWK